jgi:hypothetical protein
MKYGAVLLLFCLLCVGCVNAITMIISASQIQNCVPPDSQMDINNLVIKASPNIAWVAVDNQDLGKTPISIYAENKQIYEGPHQLLMWDSSPFMNFWTGTFQICPNKVTIINLDDDWDHYNADGTYKGSGKISSSMKSAAAVTVALATIKPATTTLGTTIPTATVPVTQITAAPQIPVQGTRQSASGPVAASAGSGAVSGSASGGQAGNTVSQTATGQPQAGTGSLSVTTTPAGAAIFIDGVQRGVSPATIPGLVPGDHTLLLKLDGYAELSTPVSIIAGETQEYTTALAKSAKTPGFAFISALVAVAALILSRNKIIR